MNKKLLSLANVHKSYVQGNQKIEVLKGVTVTFIAGHSYALTGASGSGKSTLVHLLAGLDTPTSGIISYNERNIYTLRPEQKNIFLSTAIGLVFQYPYLIKELTVLENVMAKGFIAHKDEASVMGEAQVLIEQVGLKDKLHAYPGQLSGGQAQRVAIARALMNRPDFLIADEPTGNLDQETGNKIIDLLMELAKKWNMGLIISSHDAYVTKKMEIMYELKDGQLKVYPS